MHIVDLNPKKIGAFEEYMIALTNELISQGNNVLIYFVSEVPETFKVHFGNAKLFVLTPYCGHLNFYLTLAKNIFKYKPDILHYSFYPCYSLTTNIISKLCGAKHIIYSDRVSGDADYNIGIKKYATFIRNYISYALIDKVICVSNFVMDRNSRLPGINPKKLCCIHNGINIGRYNKHTKQESIRNELGVGIDDFLIGTVATMADYKGIPYLIEAAHIISPKINNARFILVGEGEKLEGYKALVRSIGIKDSFRFLGLRNDVERILDALDVFVYPSTWSEAFGFAIAEAMIKSLPVIASDVGGIPELIEIGKTGFLVPKENSSKLAAAIETLYFDTPLRMRMGQKAAETARVKFGLDRMIREYLDVYKENGLLT